MFRRNITATASRRQRNRTATFSLGAWLHARANTLIESGTDFARGNRNTGQHLNQPLPG
jgi:hypothetical protein